MANQEKVSGIYGKPNFPLIVGLFAVGIVVLLICGWFFLRSGTLKLKGTNGRRTGMTIVVPLPIAPHLRS